MKIPLVLATRSPGKLREIQALLADLPVAPVLLPEDAPEVAETGGTFAGNAELKARAAARLLRIPYCVLRIPYPTRSTRDLPLTLPDTEYAIRNSPFVLADDSGLEVDALGGAPGVQSARYAGLGGSDAACVAKLLEEMRGIPDAARTARFRCAMALLAPNGRLWLVEGTCEGWITHAPRGEHGFGYDPVFLLPELDLTMAELPPEQKNRISHRAQALVKVADLLRRML